MIGLPNSLKHSSTTFISCHNFRFVISFFRLLHFTEFVFTFRPVAAVKLASIDSNFRFQCRPCLPQQPVDTTRMSLAVRAIESSGSNKADCYSTSVYLLPVVNTCNKVLAVKICHLLRQLHSQFKRK